MVLTAQFLVLYSHHILPPLPIITPWPPILNSPVVLRRPKKTCLCSLRCAAVGDFQRGPSNSLDKLCSRRRALEFHSTCLRWQAERHSLLGFMRKNRTHRRSQSDTSKIILFFCKDFVFFCMKWPRGILSLTTFYFERSTFSSLSSCWQTSH